MQFSKADYENHKLMGSISTQFLKYLEANPELAQPMDAGQDQFDKEMGTYLYPIQPWPLLMEGDVLAEIRKQVACVPDLVKAIPERLFGNNGKKLAEFFDQEDLGFTELLQSSHAGLDNAFGRLDLYLTEGGFKVLETNFSALVGGWQCFFSQQRQANTPLMRGFRESHPFKVTMRNVMQDGLVYAITQAMTHPAIIGNRLNFAFLIDIPLDATVMRYCNHIMEQVLKARGSHLKGRVVLCPYDKIRIKNGYLKYRNIRIHAMMVLSSKPMPRAIVRSVVDGKVAVFNTPISNVLGDKRCLALLSQNQESDLFSAQERAQIKAYIPWTRELKPGKTEYQGGSFSIPEDLYRQRESWVLKKGNSLGGRDVYIGNALSKEEWLAAVEKATKEGGWIVQEFQKPKDLIFFNNLSKKPEPHKIAWGVFFFGPNYGGTWLRTMPSQSNAQIINSAKGASETSAWECQSQS